MQKHGSCHPGLPYPSPLTDGEKHEMTRSRRERALHRRVAMTLLDGDRRLGAGLGDGGKLCESSRHVLELYCRSQLSVTGTSGELQTRMLPGTPPHRPLAAWATMIQSTSDRAVPESCRGTTEASLAKSAKTQHFRWLRRKQTLHRVGGSLAYCLFGLSATTDVCSVSPCHQFHGFSTVLMFHFGEPFPVLPRHRH
jgi:hypothetical protein